MRRSSNHARPSTICSASTRAANVAEMVLSAVSLTTVVAAFQHGHYFAGPFAALFAVGYASVAYLVISEQAMRRRAERGSIPAPAPAEPARIARAA